MNTIGIKVKSYTNEVNIVNNSDIERRLLKILLLSFGILAILYVIFLGNIIFNIVQRKNIEMSIRDVGNEVMTLESTYLAMSSKLDLDYSHTIGFNDAKATFAVRKTLPSLGYNFGSVKSANNEI